MKVDIEIRGIKTALKNFKKFNDEQKKGVKQSVAAAALDIQLEAKKLAPVKDSVLKNSINVEISEDGLTGEIGSNVHYATDVEYGTVPHVIRATNAKVLSDGTNFFGTEVNHPGTSPQPFLFPAYEKTRPKFVKKIKSILGIK